MLNLAKISRYKKGKKTLVVGGGGLVIGKDMGGWWRFFWGLGRAETSGVEGGRSPLLISKPAHNWKRVKRISGAAYLTVKVKNKTKQIVK